MFQYVESKWDVIRKQLLKIRAYVWVDEVPVWDLNPRSWEEVGTERRGTSESQKSV